METKGDGIAAAAALAMSTIASASGSVTQREVPAPIATVTLELGVEALFEDPAELALLEGQRVGLITNPTGSITT